MPWPSIPSTGSSTSRTWMPTRLADAIWTVPGLEDIVTTGLEWPMSIALDIPAEMLFWGDQTAEQIGYANLDGTGSGVLLSTPFNKGLAIDSGNGKIYWSTSITSTAGDILRANLDGTMVETVITEVDKPGRIALDIPGGKIYWTDHVVDVVRRANLDGTGVEDIYIVGANLNPDGIALDLDAGKVYWAQAVMTNSDRIRSMNLDGSMPEDLTDTTYGIVSTIAFVIDDPVPDCEGDANGDDVDSRRPQLDELRHRGVIQLEVLCVGGALHRGIDLVNRVDFGDDFAAVEFLGEALVCRRRDRSADREQAEDPQDEQRMAGTREATNEERLVRQLGIPLFEIARRAEYHGVPVPGDLVLLDFLARHTTNSG